ncbi:MAG TPA: DUF4097 family beta strand repeat-containing protein, partial [Melioribacteraceae bacterium]|nr:DUF4097 family beta strand repeat-containing protein [Melioribacteraceae bacterium]
YDGGELSISSLSGKEDEMPISVKQEGNIYTIVNKRNSFVWGGADLDIKLPKKMNLKINSTSSDIEIRGTLDADFKVSVSAGDITTDNINGDVIIKTSGGDIRMGNLKGRIEISTFGGDIRAGAIYSDKLIKIETAGGDIKLGKIEGESKISTSGGTISIEEIKREGSIVTSGGDIIIRKIEGKYKVKTYGGDIRIDEGKGVFSVESGGGDIKAKNIIGSAKTKTYAGDIYLGISPSGNDDSNAKTSSGNVYLHLPSNESALVDVKIIGGYYPDDEESMIDSDYNGSLESNRKSGGAYYYKYNINGGKNRIYIETNNGSVSIKKNKKGNN